MLGGAATLLTFCSLLDFRLPVVSTYLRSV